MMQLLVKSAGHKILTTNVVGVFLMERKASLRLIYATARDNLVTTA